jgi:Fur family peroxide stress response transcriptional regulator
MSFVASSLDKLRHAGLKLTNQRRAILEFFSEQRGHHTPQDVHDALAHRYQNLSAATVYNALETFEELNIVQRFNLDGGRAYFDANTHEHHHARCRQCGTVIDVEIPEATMTRFLVDHGLDGFVVSRAHLHIMGNCANCAAN